MALSNDLVSQFAKSSKKMAATNNAVTLYGTIVEYESAKYVQIDGSEILTPFTSTVSVKNGERVLVRIANHTAVVIGNVTITAARSDDMADVTARVGEFDTIIAGKADFDDLKASNARIDNLVAENATIKDKLTANEADIKTITADNVTIKDTLKANTAEIDTLKSTVITAEEATLKFATIENLNATDAKITNLQAEHGKFVQLTTDKFTANEADIKDLKAADVTITGRLDANEADINDLTANKANISDLQAVQGRIEILESHKITTDELIAKKADIDLANVNNAWIQNGIIIDGSIGEAAIHNGAITNVKIADATIEAAKIKTVNADTITVGTLKTERLIITGSDGQDSIVKAINIANGVAEADVNGQKIQAASIEVVDLSAFQAKIAGFDMSGNAIYSGKESIKDPNSGIYISTTGIGMGDGSLTGKNEAPLQAYADGSFKLTGKNSSFDFNTVTGELDIEASSLKISSKSVATKDDIDQVRDEITTLLRIESSRGTVFKNDQVATVLSVVLYHGKQRITDSATMKEVFGSGAYLQWHWQRLDDESFGVLSSSDPRFGDEGFAFTLSPEDVDTKVTFMCELITE